MNAEPPITCFQMEHQPRRPGYARRYPAQMKFKLRTLFFLMTSAALMLTLGDAYGVFEIDPEDRNFEIQQKMLERIPNWTSHFKTQTYKVSDLANYLETAHGISVLVTPEDSLKSLRNAKYENVRLDYCVHSALGCAKLTYNIPETFCQSPKDSPLVFAQVGPQLRLSCFFCVRVLMDVITFWLRLRLRIQVFLAGLCIVLYFASAPETFLRGSGCSMDRSSPLPA